MTSSQRRSRIISHGKLRRSRFFSFLSRICELSNFNHTDYHGGHGRQKFDNSQIRDKEKVSGRKKNIRDTP